jgi:hypothetical protein
LKGVIPSQLNDFCFQFFSSRRILRRYNTERLMIEQNKAWIDVAVPIETVTAGSTERMDPFQNVPSLLAKLRAAIQETA